MKKLKKLAALLLAGAMVLVLFTACGGSTASEDTKAEDQVMVQINTGRAEKLSNDEQMRATANKYLDADISGGLFGYFSSHKVHVDWDGNKATVTVVAKYDYNGTNLDRLIGYITGDNQTSNIDINQSSKWSKVGVVVKTVQGQTYVAVSVQAGKLS